MFLDGEAATFDIVHAHYGPVGLRAARLLDAGVIQGRLVVTFHGFDALVVPRESGAHVYAHLFEQAAALTSGSEYMREQLLDLGASSDRTVVVPIGIDLNVFSPDDEARPNVAATRLLSVARLIEAKGVQIALNAVLRLKEMGVNVTYTIIGDGPFRRELETLARDLEISDVVTFKGEQSEEEIQEAYRSADVFLHPALHGEDGWVEGQGLVLAEAQATKLPVIASRCGGIPESMNAGITGYLVPEGDYEEIAARVAHLVKHPREGIAMGKAGREFVETRFNLDSYLSRLEALYTGLLAQ
jgi:colanic acid/amylovoran biosynthesis glycosyltransferase